MWHPHIYLHDSVKSEHSSSVTCPVLECCGLYVAKAYGRQPLFRPCQFRCWPIVDLRHSQSPSATWYTSSPSRSSAMKWYRSDTVMTQWWSRWKSACATCLKKWSQLPGCHGWSRVNNIGKMANTTAAIVLFLTDMSIAAGTLCGAFSA